MIKLKIWRWGGYLGLSRRTQVSLKEGGSGRLDCRRRHCNDLSRERSMDANVGLEDGGRGHKPRNARQTALDPGRQGNVLSLTLGRGRPTDTAVSTQ